jgi:hypothetical protein
MKKGQRLKRFCPMGHDKDVVGTDRWNHCIGCHRVRTRIDPSKDSRIKNICKNGHDISVVGRNKWGECKACKTIRSVKQHKKWAKENPEKVKAAYKRWCENNKERKKEIDRIAGAKYRKNNKEKLRLKAKRYRESDPERVKRLERNAHLLRKFGITIEQYEQLLWEQKFRCLGCNIHQSKLQKPLAVDHDHKTGKVRGLLCDPCNIALGCVKDSTKILSQLIKYLN